MITTTLRSILAALSILLIAAQAQAVQIPLDLGDGITTWMRSEISPGALPASTPSYDVGYVTNYQYAQGVWLGGKFFPNIVDGAKTWKAYISEQTPVTHTVSGWSNGAGYYAKDVYGSGNTITFVFSNSLSAATTTNKTVTLNGASIIADSGWSGASGAFITDFYASNNSLTFRRDSGSRTLTLTGRPMLDSGWASSCSGAHYLVAVQATPGYPDRLAFQTTSPVGGTGYCATGKYVIFDSTACWETGYYRTATGNANQPLCGAGTVVKAAGVVDTNTYFLGVAAQIYSGQLKAYSGTISPDSWGLVPFQPNIDWTYVQTGITRNALWTAFEPTANWIWPSTNSTYISNIAGAIQSGPSSFWQGAGLIEYLSLRTAMVKYPDGRVDGFNFGVSNGQSLLQDLTDTNTATLYINKSELGWQPTANQQAMTSYLFQNAPDPSQVRLFGHSLGNIENIGVGNRGWAAEVFGYAPISFIDPAVMVDRSYVNYTMFTGTNDILSNVDLYGSYSFNHADRLAAGVSDYQINTGLTGFNMVEGHALERYFTNDFSWLPNSWPTYRSSF